MNWKNKDEIKQYMKQYRKTHKEQRKKYLKEHEKEIKSWEKKYGKKYRLEHKEEIKKQQEEYYIKNKERLNARMKKYRRDNSNKLKKYFKEIAIRDREKIRIRQRKKIANRRKNDIAFRLKDSLGSRLRVAIKGITKADTTMNLVGCSRGYLLNYLESQFDDEMSWNNYGRNGWHIDHIIPCSHFDLSKEEEQRKCFHYSNLRPLWANDNLSRRFEDNIKIMEE